METAHKNQIIEGVIWKQLLIFFFPIVLGTFFQQLYNTVDTVIVGRFVGKEALASVGGSAGQLVNLVVGFFTGLTSGAAVVVSQFWGAKDRKNIEKSIHTAYAFSIAAGLLITVLGMLLTPVFLRWMNTPEGLMPGSILYLRIYYGGILFTFIFNTGSSILRATGDSRRPLYFLIVSCLLNIALDLLLVVTFRLGVLGVALGTFLAQLVSAGLVLLSLTRTTQIYHLNLKKIAFDRPMLRRIVVIGLPAGFQGVMYSVSNIIIQTSVNTFGTDVAAAWSAYGKIDGLFWMIMSAFGVAITTFSGQNFGAGRYDRIHQSVKVCMAMSAGTAILMTVVLYFGGELVYHLFTNDDAVIREGMVILRLLVPCYITYIAIENITGAVRGAGDSILPMIITCIGICVLRVAWIALAVPRWTDIRCVCLSYPITWTVTSISFIIYYLQGGWLRRRIAVEEQARLAAEGPEME